MKDAFPTGAHRMLINLWICEHPILVNTVRRWLSLVRVDWLGVQNDGEIIWSKLEGCNLGLWTGRDLQRRWKALKFGIKDYDTKTHQGNCLSYAVLNGAELLNRNHEDPPSKICQHPIMWCSVSGTIGCSCSWGIRAKAGCLCWPQWWSWYTFPLLVVYWTECLEVAYILIYFSKSIVDLKNDTA